MNTADAKRVLETALICTQQPLPVRELRVPDDLVDLPDGATRHVGRGEPRLPGPGIVGRERAAPRTLMFLTTFDGSSIQYIDAFVRVVPAQIAALYTGARGFPGPRRFRPRERCGTRVGRTSNHRFARRNSRWWRA